ncbi:hypothetical protein DRP53_03050 [candidate division WOR-3 bacterium]|uniref:Uncharacterized protein n=1 Tax=candidate division WOR-3 bacterium TaxID=2052148 RepID=A0A660SJN3_UNCW3|nr:MAG: hypothetical protein DRP53_03050 [candidate division WOR-3 bacterium]
MLVLLACKGVESLKEQTALIDNMKTEIQSLKDSVALLSAQLDSLKTAYEDHLSKYHAGRTGGGAPQPKERPRVKK